MSTDVETLARRVENAVPDPVARAAQMVALADPQTCASIRNPETRLVHVLSDRICPLRGV